MKKNFISVKKINLELKKIRDVEKFPGCLKAYRAVLNFMLPRNIHCLPRNFEHSGKILMFEDFGNLRILCYPKITGTL
jgi:hypothetical protein